MYHGYAFVLKLVVTILFVCFSVSLVNVVGIFLEDGAVCTYYNFALNGSTYESGDLLELPRGRNKATVVILGIHGNLFFFS